MIYGETNEELATRVKRWRPWFAWHPVALPDGRRVWLQRVERRIDMDVIRMMPIMPFTAPPKIWEYRLPEAK